MGPDNTAVKRESGTAFCNPRVRVAQGFCQSAQLHRNAPTPSPPQYSSGRARAPAQSQAQGAGPGPGRGHGWGRARSQAQAAPPSTRPQMLHFIKWVARNTEPVLHVAVQHRFCKLAFVNFAKLCVAFYKIIPVHEIVILWGETQCVEISHISFAFYEKSLPFYEMGFPIL